MFYWLCYEYLIPEPSKLQNTRNEPHTHTHTHTHTQSAKLKNDVLHNLFISKPMCGTMAGIYLVWCNKLHEGETCLPMQQWGDTHLWQQFQRGSCWCCAGLCRYRRRRQHHSTGRWGSTALLLHTQMNNRCHIHTCNVILYAYLYTEIVYSDQFNQNFFNRTSNQNKVCRNHIWICATRVWRTLSASVSAAGDGSSVLSGPVEIVRRAAGHLTPESHRASLGCQDPLWINLHHEGGRSCKVERS